MALIAADTTFLIDLGKESKATTEFGASIP